MFNFRNFFARQPMRDSAFVCFIIAILVAAALWGKPAHAQSVAVKANVATSANVTGIGAITSYSSITGATTAKQGALSGVNSAAVQAGAHTDYQAQAYTVGSGQGAGTFSANLKSIGLSAAAATLQGEACESTLPLAATAQTTATLSLVGVTGQGGAVGLLGDSTSHGTLSRGVAEQSGIPVTTITATTVANNATSSVASSLITLDGSVLAAPKTLVAGTTATAGQRLGRISLISTDE